ncbi:MAG: ATP-binding cassette domain-containing protein, partial [Gammaproteobacteria bacterium]|nr:ATP-binding cassette domain-containing protein [Gammaproteobacteria bacterium]
MAYGERIIQRELNFTINRGDIFIIMGGSGCGKSTLLRHLVGLMPPAKGRILYQARDFWQVGEEERRALMQRIGVLYQSG